MFARLKTFLIGKRRDIYDPNLFHKVSLIAFMAWVGLGADGLSSSAYGPEEAFKGLGQHKELVFFLAIATALTVFIISYAYSRIIEHFPYGGGGYVVATKLLGAPFGVVSGSALLVDYVLTISVSIASGADQIFSFLPLSLHSWKLPFEAGAIILLIFLNLRGVKESVTLLTPIFLFFVVSHVGLLAAAFVTHTSHLPEVIGSTRSGLSSGMAAIGFVGLFKIFARSYAQGAGTFTGIEAVSNGVQVMREPKVRTAKRTMVYMATSLAVTAAGLLLVYTLVDVKPQEGKTLNAVLSESLGFGPWFVVSICIAEAALLVIAAQTGFIDGPRIMANMAHDSWLPHRFSSLSERLTNHYGILLIGGSALATLFSTGGNTDKLVYMYSINVFVTFSLSELGMCKFWITERKAHPDWLRHLPIHATGLVLCTSILTLQIAEKWTEGGRETAGITLALIVLCFIIKAYYKRVQARLALISADKLAPPDMVSERSLAVNPATLERDKRTAVLLVGGYNGLGVHAVLTLWRMFPNDFPQIVFISVGVLESGNFKAQDDVDRLKAETQANLDRYIALANRLGMAGSSRQSIGTDPVEECQKLCLDLAKDFPRSTFFAGKLVFQRPKWYHRILHNQTAQAIQQALEWEGVPMFVLPVRVRG
ncbi:MAG TPA: APC family permease [Planctomycetota bacterium]|nr:APC family permease [Planctomycetota bacterium]